MNIKIKRTIICMIFFIITFFALNNVFAKDLVYEAKLDADKYMTYANYVKAKNPGDGKIKDKESNPKDYPDDITDNFVSDTSYYKTVGLIFHKNYASLYSESNRGENDQLVYFDVSQSNLDSLSLGLYRTNYIDKVSGGGTWVGNNTSNYIDSAIFTIDNNTKNSLDGTNTLVNIQSRTDEDYFTENRFKIGPKAVEALQNNLKEQDITVENGFYNIRFSNIISTGNKNYYTAQAMFNNMGKTGWEIRNYGKWHLWSGMTNYDPYSHNGTAIGLNKQYLPEDVGTTYWFAAGSILNEYDNKMLIPVAEERSVYVVHWLFNEDGTYKRYLPKWQEYNKLPDEVQIDINGEKRHWYGWSEQYSSNDKLEICNKVEEINDKYSTSEYKLIGYEIYEVNDDGSEGSIVAEGSYDKVGMLKNDEPWISFDSDSRNVIFGSANGVTTKKNYAVHYKYAKSNTTGSKKLYVGHAYSTKSSGIKYADLKKTKLTGSEEVSVNSSKLQVDGWLNEYTFYDSITIKDPKLNNSTYKLKGYVKFTYNINSSYFRSEYVSNKSLSKIEYPSTGITISNKRAVVIFIYDDDGPPPEDEKTPDINVSAWLDYINPNDSIYSSTTSKEYKESGEYKSTKLLDIYAEFKNTTGFADTVPSNSKLKPYIRTAPFVIQGIKIEPSDNTNKDIESDTCTINVSYSYKTSCSCEGTPHDYDTESGSYTGTYTRKITVKWWKYEIFNLTMAHISDITIEQDNIAKLFDKFNNKIELNGNFYKDKVIATSPDIEAFLDITSKSKSIGLYNSKTEAESAAKEEAENLAEDVKINKIVYTIYDDKIYVNDKYSDILKSGTYSGEINNINGASFCEINKDKVSSGKKYDEVIKSYIEWDTEERLKEMTKYTDFKDNYSIVSDNFTKENGVRELTATLTYKSKNIMGSSKYTPTWYSTSSGAASGNKEITFNNQETYEFSLNNENLKYPKVRIVDVYDPIGFKNWSDIVETTTLIDHTLGGGIGTALVLQPNTEFTIKAPFKTDKFGYGTSINSTNNVEKCWVVFDFPVIQEGEIIPAGTKIEIDIHKGSKFKTTDDFKALTNNNKNNIRLIAYSKNATSALKEYYGGVTVKVETEYSNYHRLKLSLTKFIDSKTNNLLSISSSDNSKNQEGYITKGVTYSSNHAITTALQDDGNSSKNVFRMYDFSITDCTDLAYKDVFRKTSGTGVNEHTGMVYWSGIKKLIIYGSDQNNYLVERSNFSDINGIGSSPKRILPLGPYKNTDKTYINAPKLGYRISFNLKTTGNLEDYSQRKIVIIPRYYFVSKSGEYIPPEDIRLYYKNIFGKYVSLKGYQKKSGNIISSEYEDYYEDISGSEFSISFTPNDGYRFLGNTDVTPNTDNMSSSKVKLNMSELSLTSKMMTTDDKYIQSWYGEFKLPNSTIAVKKVDGKYNVNNPLTDGYIGVIFDIYCVNENGNTLSYSQNNRDSSKKTILNTSQWDYEGYMGFNSPGNNANVSLQLEKGTWNISNDVYNQIKGTVLLYDADNRAANDYD